MRSKQAGFRAGAGLVLFLPWAIAVAAPLWVGRFDPAQGEQPPGWRIERPNPNTPPTRYRVRMWDGVAAVEAWATKSMALLARELDINLAATPVLCWRWRVDAPLKTADMARRAGDDFPARVYLSFRVPPESLGTTDRLALAAGRLLHGEALPDAALNYVWDNRHPVGTWQANAYTDRARMLVLRMGAAEAEHWVAERRDLGADFQAAFGHAPLALTGLAIASDTDNTGETAHAGFADFHFVGKNEDCA
ncbi:MAG: DUF3047 domain-containing protein [Rhodocyclales bacterium]|nr:DUF3047 domain-containing protein [Rhodocyclales bacterium]